MRDSKFPQVSRTLLSFLVDLNNAVVWMVSTCPLFSESSSPCTSPLVTVPSALITIDIIITVMFHSFFPVLWQGLGTYFLFAFLKFYSVVSLNGKVHYSAAFFFFFFFFFFLQTTTRPGRLAEIKRSVCITKFRNIFCVEMPGMDSVLCTYHSFVGSNINF